MRLILDMKADRLEEGFSIAQSFIRDYPHHPIGWPHFVGYTHGGSGNRYSVHRTKTGLTVMQSAKAKDRK